MDEDDEKVKRKELNRSRKKREWDDKLEEAAENLIL